MTEIICPIQPHEMDKKMRKGFEEMESPLRLYRNGSAGRMNFAASAQPRVSQIPANVYRRMKAGHEFASMLTAAMCVAPILRQ